jgi:hypothetical protein
MKTAPAEFRPSAQLAHLTAYGVDFVVIGGIAATLHGSSRDTFDLDICPLQDDDNLDILGRALLDLDARLRGVEEDVPFVPDGRTLRGMQVLTLDTSLGPLDILMRPDGCPPYGQLRRRARRMDVGVAGVLVASVDDLLEMKRGSNRKKDQADVEELEAIKRLERRLRRSPSEEA